MKSYLQIFILIFFFCNSSFAQEKPFKKNAIYLDLTQTILLNPKLSYHRYFKTKDNKLRSISVDGSYKIRVGALGGFLFTSTRDEDRSAYTKSTTRDRCGIWSYNGFTTAFGYNYFLPTIRKKVFEKYAIKYLFQYHWYDNYGIEFGDDNYELSYKYTNHYRMQSEKKYSTGLGFEYGYTYLKKHFSYDFNLGVRALVNYRIKHVSYEYYKKSINWDMAPTIKENNNSYTIHQFTGTFLPHISFRIGFLY